MTTFQINPKKSYWPTARLIVCSIISVNKISYLHQKEIEAPYINKDPTIID